ncbi:MAG TPA: hypothetical protein VLB82_07760 [Thermodesulfobacteriota bacterium]|nr:hypothetical protein [Thermodesulfobacteriota bacterium]
MIKSKTSISIILLLLFALLAGYSTQVIAGSAGPYASGHGNLVEEGDLRTFSFHARELKNSKVIGSLVLKNRSVGVRVKAKLDCLEINGNQATMSGIITQIMGEGLDSLLGDEVWFRVEDNGEGFRNTGDRMTLLIVEVDEPPDPDECTEDLGLGLMNIRAGNIQVNP